MLRLRLLALVWITLLALGTSAQANTINFGSPTNSSSCSLAGDAGDRSCTNAATVSNGANDAAASAAIVAQASADHGITTNPTAIADMTVSYSIPYTVTRTVTVEEIINPNGPDKWLTIPNQTITLNLNFSGEVSKDNGQVGGGLANSLQFGGASVTSARFGNATLGVGASQGGPGGIARTTFNNTVPDIVGSAGRNFDDPTPEADGVFGYPVSIGDEISFAFQIPTDYQDWDDFFGPFAIDYNGIPPSQNFTQSFTDTLTITFRLRAESRPSGSVSTTGGEALACAGQTSPLGSFVLDDAASCGSGLTIAASVAQTGFTSEPVPEPTTLGLIGLGLAGVAILGSRRRKG